MRNHIINLERQLVDMQVRKCKPIWAMQPSNA
jgi:hypothetical protein